MKKLTVLQMAGEHVYWQISFVVLPALVITVPFMSRHQEMISSCDRCHKYIDGFVHRARGFHCCVASPQILAQQVPIFHITTQVAGKGGRDKSCAQDCRWCEG